MARNVNKFIRELVDYINDYASKQNDKIKKAETFGTILNRGHAINILVNVPDDVTLTDDDNEALAMVFYAEELLNEYPNNTTAMIGEVVSQRVNEGYDNFINVFRQQKNIKNHTIDKCDLNEIIITAIPYSQATVDKIAGNGGTKLMVYKGLDDLMLHTMLKAPIMSVDQGNGSTQAYYCPIMRNEIRITKKYWEMAKKNSLRHAKVGFSHIQGAPFLGNAADVNQFYEYFYLLSAQDVFEPIIKAFDATKIIISPLGPYVCAFMILTPMIEEMISIVKNETVQGFIDGIYKGRKVMPVFELDAKTMRLSELKQINGVDVPKFVPNPENNNNN